MIILDTDHFNILQIGKGTAYDALAGRMDASPDQDFSTTVVTFEEHIAAGSPGFIAREIADQVRPYDQLIKLIRFFQAWNILRFSEDAASTFRGLRQQRVRIGTLDLKIASIALEHGATLLSANARDFDLVPGLRVKDWLHSAG